MNSERVIEMFQCMKMHLSSKSYDYFRYNGKKKASGKRVPINPYAVSFARKFTKEEDFLSFMIANQVHFMLANSKVSNFIGDFAGEESYRNYEKYLGYKDTYVYTVESDLKRLFAHKEKMKDFDFLLGKALKNEISFYTLILLNAFTNLKKNWQENSVIYEEYRLFFEKSISFCCFDKNTFTKTLLKAKDEYI